MSAQLSTAQADARPADSAAQAQEPAHAHDVNGHGPLKSNAVAKARPKRFDALGLLLPVGALLTLEVLVWQGVVPRHLLPPPSDWVITLTQLGLGTVAEHALTSSARVLTGFALGASLAVLIGALVGLQPLVARLLDPTFQALRAIPSLAWVPLLLLWLGIDEAPKIVLIAIGAFFPVYLGVSSGLRDVDRKLVEVARMAGLPATALVRRVLLPAAAPALMTGLRQGLSLAWMFMVAAELIAASKGLGYLLTDGRETGRADLVLSAIVLLALLGKLTDSLMQWWETRQLAWRDTFDASTR
jgi:sulfonate transport system permease protein